jgi:hypothetical protein
VQVVLTPTEIARLSDQPEYTEGDGGFQGLIVSLQRKVNSSTGEVTLSSSDLERIPRYAFDYKNGGWENT